MSIKCRTDTESKIAELWVTSGTSETEITECRTTLQHLGYYCVIFRSGREDVVQNTKALLNQNLYLR